MVSSKKTPPAPDAPDTLDAPGTTVYSIDTTPMDVTTLAPFARYAKAKLALPVFTKDKSGHGYKYVTLEDIQRAVNPILHEHGLILTDALEWLGVSYGLRTCLRDQNTGDLLGSSYFVFNIQPQYGVDKRGNPTLSYGTAQDIGGWRTYAARYNRATLLDLVLVGEDDDAASLNRAEGASTPKARTAPAPSTGDLW